MKPTTPAPSFPIVIAGFEFLTRDCQPCEGGDYYVHIVASENPNPKTFRNVYGHKAGSHYYMKSELFSLTWRIVRGTGSFYYRGRERPYKPGDTFSINAHEYHGLIRVDEDTASVIEVAADARNLPGGKLLPAHAPSNKNIPRT